MPDAVTRHVNRRILSWAIIALCVVFFGGGGRTILRKLHPRTADQVIDASEDSSGSLLLRSRYAVGASGMIRSLNPTTQSTSNTAALVQSLSSPKDSPLERLRTVPVLAELTDPQHALTELDKVEKLDLSTKMREDANYLRKIYSIGPTLLTDGERQQLIHRHGWFGKLAVTWNAKSTDPLRQEVMSAARRTMTAGITVVVLLFAAGITGLVLLILAIVFAVQGKLRSRLATDPAPVQESPAERIHYLEAFTIYLAGMLGASLIVLFLFPSWRSLSLSWYLLVLIPAAFVWPLSRHWNVLTLRQAIGWTTGRGVFTEIGAGILGYLAGLPILAIGLTLTLILNKLTGAEASHPIINEAGKGAWVNLQLYLLACVLAPVIEETMFRGALYHHLRPCHGWILSALIVGVIFAGIHPQGWTAIPMLGSIAFVLATIREWRGSLIGSITAHALNNFWAVTFLVFALG